MTTNDIDAIRAEWLHLCGLCDAGVQMECTCPKGDVRPVVSALCEEIEQLRPAIEAAQRWASVRSDRGSDGMEFHRACVALASAVDQLAAERARTQETHQ